MEAYNNGLVSVGDHHLVLDKAHPLSVALIETAHFTKAPPDQPGKKFPRLYDVNSITENPLLFQKAVDFLASRYREMGGDGPTHILAVEASGFLLGAPLALALGLPFVPIRSGTISEHDFVADGGDQKPAPPLSVRNNSIDANSRVVIVDDVISTGRTMDSAMDCVVIAGSTIVEVVAICDMSESGGVDYIHKEEAFKKINVVTLFRLRNKLETLFYKSGKKKPSML